MQLSIDIISTEVHGLPGDRDIDLDGDLNDSDDEFGYTEPDSAIIIKSEDGRETIATFNTEDEIGDNFGIYKNEIFKGSLADPQMFDVIMHVITWLKAEYEILKISYEKLIEIFQEFYNGEIDERDLSNYL